MTPIVLPFDDPEAGRLVLEALETGLTLVFPTDTIYGIGGNPWDEGVLAKVRLWKQRDADQPFTLHVPTVAAVERYAQLTERLRRTVQALLPGPYTLILPARPTAPSSAVQAAAVGIRVPDHAFFAHVMARLDRPLFGTSVNAHGAPPLLDIDEIIDQFSGIDLALTGPIGRQPSDVIDLSVVPPRALRGDLPDAVTAEMEDGPPS